jgi:hypothetical protein
MVSAELLGIERSGLIAKASADCHQWTGLLSALADTIDSLEALQEIVAAAEARMAVVLANIEADPETTDLEGTRVG